MIDSPLIFESMPIINIIFHCNQVVSYTLGYNVITLFLFLKGQHLVKITSLAKVFNLFLLFLDQWLVNMLAEMSEQPYLHLASKVVILVQSSHEVMFFY